MTKYASQKPSSFGEKLKPYTILIYSITVKYIFSLHILIKLLKSNKYKLKNSKQYILVLKIEQCFNVKIYLCKIIVIYDSDSIKCSEYIITSIKTTKLTNKTLKKSQM